LKLLENIKIALFSIKGNILRSVLTALIIAVGITALVGILTTLDGLQRWIKEDFSSMGANSFGISHRASVRVNSDGKKAKSNPRITYDEALEFQEGFTFPSSVAVSAVFAFQSTIKHNSLTTNPNVAIEGIDQYYLSANGFDLEYGRNFSENEVNFGSNSVIIGNGIVKKLFPNVTPVNKEVFIGKDKFLVVGVLKEKGGSIGFSGDNNCLLPMLKAQQISSFTNPAYKIAVSVNDVENLDYAIGEATGVLRQVRKLKSHEESNFSISKSDMLATMVIKNTRLVAVAASVIGIITLLGASISLMNIMLVSVTERTREIGVRKAMGATAKIIKQQFLIEAILICFAGGIAGIFLGVVIGNLITLLIGSGFIFPWLWILCGLLLCYTVGLASGYYPANKAAKLDPVDSLRYE
jgi:putative ABC transport system permease protein